MAKGIREWRCRHENAVAMEMYIKGVLSPEKILQLVRSQQRVIPVLAQLALLKDNLQMLVKQHGRLYRWV
jgi:phage tail tape-measure protein